MQLLEILSSFLDSGKQERRDAVASLLQAGHDLWARLGSFEKQIRANEAPSATELEGLSKALDSLPIDKLYALTGGVFGRARRELTLLQNALETSVQELRVLVSRYSEEPTARPDLAPIVKLGGVLSKLEDSLEGYETRRRTRKILVRSAWLAPIVLAYLLGVWSSLQEGLGCEHESVLFPARGYAVEGAGELRLTEGYYEEFFATFSPLFFGRPSDFSDFYYETEEDSNKGRNRVAAKLVFRNLSKADALLVSVLGIEFEKIEDTPFPWDRLDVSPSVDVSWSAGYPSLTNAGPGPVLDLHAEARSPDDSVRFVGTTAELNRGALVLRSSELEGFEPIAVRDDELRQPLWYEKDSVKVTTLTRLAAITDVVPVPSLLVTWRGSSLRGEACQGEAELAGAGFAFYRRRAGLDSMEAGETSASVGSFLNEAAHVLEALVKPSDSEPVLEGQDSIIEKFEFDLGSGDEHRARCELRNVDLILNPRGFLTVYVVAERPSNGLYRARLLLNGEALRDVTFDVLAPEVWRYSDVLDPSALGFVPPRSGH